MTTIDWVPVLEAVRKAASADVSLLDDESLCDDERAIGALRAALAAVESTRVAELDARGVTDREGMRTIGWVAATTKVSRPTASRRIRVGKALARTFPQVLDALVEGRISEDHAEQLVRVANPRIIDDLAAIQEHLVTLAENMTYAAWERELAGIVYHLDQDGPAPNDENCHRLSMVRGADGLLYLRGTLNGDAAAVVESVLNQLTDELHRRRTRDAKVDPDLPVPARSQLMADALYEAARRAVATDLGSSRPGKVEVVLHLTAGDPDDPNAVLDVVTATGVRLRDGAARLLIADPHLQAMVQDTFGLPLDLGRTVRLATAHQRRVITARDGGCAFPDCDFPPEWCDIHHAILWDHGGPTDLVNLIMLCRYHHGVTHRRGWTLHAGDDQWFYWTTPTGRRFWNQRHGKHRQGPEPPTRC